MQTIQPKHFVATSKNGHEVYMHLTHSAVAQSISRQPRLATLLAEVVAEVDLAGEVVHIEKDMGRQIGYADVVDTSAGDSVFYAMQLRTKTHTRFVKNKPAEPTNFLTIRAERDDEGNYEVTVLYLGGNIPPLPNDPEASAESQSYWQTHAVVYNGQPIVGSTMTKDWPYSQ